MRIVIRLVPWAVGVGVILLLVTVNFLDRESVPQGGAEDTLAIMGAVSAALLMGSWGISLLHWFSEGTRYPGRWVWGVVLLFGNVFGAVAYALVRPFDTDFHQDSPGGG